MHDLSLCIGMNVLMAASDVNSSPQHLAVKSMFHFIKAFHNALEAHQEKVRSISSTCSLPSTH